MLGYEHLADRPAMASQSARRRGALGPVNRCGVSDCRDAGSYNTEMHPYCYRDLTVAVVLTDNRCEFLAWSLILTNST